MKELETHFKGHGETNIFDFEQVMKSDKAYMYKKSYEDIVLSYEVFERVENPRFDCVSYPGSPSFGLWAWDFINYQMALDKFNELSK